MNRTWSLHWIDLSDHFEDAAAHTWIRERLAEFPQSRHCFLARIAGDDGLAQSDSGQDAAWRIPLASGRM